MSQYFRFRTAERLLGRAATQDSEARAGELDDLTIYFASPEELNDPLEGHRDTFFWGDEVAWRNLVKHYILILYESVIDRYAGDNKGEMHINLMPTNFLDESRNFIDRATASIQKCDAINSYIEALANSRRRVSRLELSAHLSTLHTAILGYIFEELDEELQIHETSMYVASRKNFLAYIALRARKIAEEGSSPDLHEYIEIKNKFKQQAMRGSIYRDVDLDSNGHRLFVNFPEEFSNHLDYLMYPRWYVACFMKSCSNSAIWGSYGDNHKGICLIYNSTKIGANDGLTLKKLPFVYIQAHHYGRPKNEYFLNMPLTLPLIEANYKPEYSGPNFFDSMLAVNKDWALTYWYTDESGNVSENASTLYKKPAEVWPTHRTDFLRSCTNKTAHWENETEARIILAGIELTREERLVSYSFHQLEGIIFGIKTPDTIKVQIIKKISEHCRAHRRSDFKFYQAKFDQNYQHIEYDHLKFITFNPDGTLNMDPHLPS